MINKLYNEKFRPMKDKEAIENIKKLNKFKSLDFKFNDVLLKLKNIIKVIENDNSLIFNDLAGNNIKINISYFKNVNFDDYNFIFEFKNDDYYLILRGDY